MEQNHCQAISKVLWLILVDIYNESCEVASSAYRIINRFIFALKDASSKTTAKVCAKLGYVWSSMCYLEFGFLQSSCVDACPSISWLLQMTNCSL